MAIRQSRVVTRVVHTKCATFIRITVCCKCYLYVASMEIGRLLSDSLCWSKWAVCLNERAETVVFGARILIIIMILISLLWVPIPDPLRDANVEGFVAQRQPRWMCAVGLSARAIPHQASILSLPPAPVSAGSVRSPSGRVPPSSIVVRSVELRD